MPPVDRPTRLPHGRRDLWSGLAVAVLALAVRAPRLTDSLWLDEMTTLDRYVRGPSWATVLATPAGDYLPNNHVLYSVLARLIYPTPAAGQDAPPLEALLRAPACLAGVILPVVLAWPLRRRAPLASVTVAVVAALNPWLVALGTEARGYTLTLLLGVVATLLLPGPAASRRRLLAYAAAVAAAVYTVPLSVLLVPAHAVVTMATGGWPAVRRWAIATALAGGASVALYLPLAGGVLAYYAHPFPATMTYRSFLDALPRVTLAGQRWPLRTDPTLDPLAAYLPDPAGSSVYWALPVLTVIAGTAVGWRRHPSVRPLLASLALVTVFGVALAAVLPQATEVRFDAWAGPWFCLCVGVLLAAIAEVRPVAIGRTVAVAGGVVLVFLCGRWINALGTNQPVRQAMQWVDAHAPDGRVVVVAYVGGTETADCYAGDAPHHQVVPVPTADWFRRTDDELLARTGQRPWVVVPFEAMMREREPGFWRELVAHYRVVARLPGRFSAMTILAPRTTSASHMTAWARAAGRP